MRPTPGRFIVTIRPVTMTMSVVILRNVKGPGLLDDGSTKLNDTSSNDLGVIEKFVSVGVATFTVKFAVIEPEVYPPPADCVAVMRVCPTFLIVTVLPDISATVVSLLVNENVESGFKLFVVGFVKINGALPNTREATLKFDNVGWSDIFCYRSDDM